MRFWRNLRIGRIEITRHARIGSLWIRKPKNPSYPHTGDNYVENISSYPPNGDNQVDNLGTSFVRVPIPLVVTCLSEPKVIYSPLFLNDGFPPTRRVPHRQPCRFAGHSLTAYAASHVVAGGVVHGSTRVSRHLLQPYCLEMVSPAVAPNDEPSARVRSNSMSSSSGS